MPPWGPVNRRVLVATLRRVGFEGPYSGGKHEFMVRGCTVGHPIRRKGSGIGCGSEPRREDAGNATLSPEGRWPG
jgi:hypothetical protein